MMVDRDEPNGKLDAGNQAVLRTFENNGGQ
jgi:hypothetical protein